MLRNLAAAAVCAMLFGMSAPASAGVISGWFVATIFCGNANNPNNTLCLDPTHSLGLNTDLTGQTMLGTFSYDPSLLNPINPATYTSTGQGLGALTIAVQIGSRNFVFTSGTSSSVGIDPLFSQFELQTRGVVNASGQQLGGSFSLLAADPVNPFISISSFDQNFYIQDPLINSGSFSITENDTLMTVFNLNYTITQLDVPEPSSLILLITALFGVLFVRTSKNTVMERTKSMLYRIDF
jgi:hypothetical protein